MSRLAVRFTVVGRRAEMDVIRAARLRGTFYGNALRQADWDDRLMRMELFGDDQHCLGGSFSIRIAPSPGVTSQSWANPRYANAYINRARATIIAFTGDPASATFC
jgi:hypothetical protein